MPLYSGPVKMLVTPPCGASSNIALWRAYSKPPVELVVADLELYLDSSPAQRNLILFYNEGVNAWLENMEDYKSGGDTAVEMLDYVGQSVELDAITYSKEEADALYGEIDKLLNEDVE